MGDSSSVYAQARPLEGSVDDFTNGQKASDMMYRKMGIERENEFARQEMSKNTIIDRQNADIDKRYGGTIKSEGKFTTNVQELNMNTLSTLSTRLQEVTDKIKDPSLSEQERNKYRVEADAIHNSPSAIKTAGENLSTAYASHLKDVEEGKAYLNTKLKDAATLGYGATAIWDSEKNQVVYAIKQKGENGELVDQDTNKDGQIDSLDYVTIGDLIADTGKFKSEERYKPEDVFKRLKSDVSTRQVVRNDGTIENISVAPSKQQATGIVNRYFMANDGSLTPMGKSILIEDKVNYNDADAVSKYMNQYANDLVGTKNTKDTNKQVTSDATNARQNKTPIYDTLSVTTKNLTPIGIAAQKRFRANPANEGYEMDKSDYPLNSFITNKKITKTLATKTPTGKKPKANTTNKGGNIR